MASIYIYNVSPDSVHDSVGTFGTYVLKGKQADEPYGRTLITDRVYMQDKGDKEFDRKIESGETLAADILSRCVGYGLFVSAEKEPTDEEVKNAQDNLALEDIQRVRAADNSWEKKHDRSLINDMGRQAARRRGYKPEWIDADAKQLSQEKRCPHCDETIRAAAIVCKHCHLRVDASSLPVAIPPAAEPVFAQSKR